MISEILSGIRLTSQQYFLLFKYWNVFISLFFSFLQNIGHFLPTDIYVSTLSINFSFTNTFLWSLTYLLNILVSSFPLFILSVLRLSALRFHRSLKLWIFQFRNSGTLANQLSRFYSIYSLNRFISIHPHTPVCKRNSSIHVWISNNPTLLYNMYKISKATNVNFNKILRYILPFISITYDRTYHLFLSLELVTN